ncbi:hypothetical protein CYMTET_49382 [Cymbomonas tetramitiformis]|uniref:Glycoside hydrolase family 28 protein n=1 Tax=Cymbomonas tetramitiformis TaxID=36881 RepID=A0AAE0BRI8_9CHLO|nr:hypothetical protein CYMTET_49382 [Cymbomonas tetramitiformis]
MSFRTLLFVLLAIIRPVSALASSLSLGERRSAFLRSAEQSVTATDAITYTMLPGQSFKSYPGNTTWHISSWGAECVVKLDPKPDGACCPYAVVRLASGAKCPVGRVFKAADAILAKDWLPYTPGLTTPTVHVFNGTKDSGLLKCNDDATPIENTRLMNSILTQLAPGDTLVVPPGVYCMGAGVIAYRLRHVVVDINGELYFSQGMKEWPKNANDYLIAMNFFGLTNVTFTSTTRKGLVKASGCTKWYAERLAHGGGEGGNTLFHIGPDVNLTYASSEILIEHLSFEDGPDWQTYLEKITNVVVRHVSVKITCLPVIGTVTEIINALALNTDGIDVWGSNVHIHDVDIVNGDDCICVKGNADGSGIMSENWLVENSSATGEGLSIGTMWSGNFTTRNVTFRNIEMPHTRKGIYIKVDTEGNVVEDVLYQNITLLGSTLQFPVMIGPIHQFTDQRCAWSWPWIETGTCGTFSNARVNVSIDGLHISRPNGFPSSNMADMVIIGNNISRPTVRLANIKIDGLFKDKGLKTCDDPPTTAIGYCDNACYSANVITDGSYPIKCTAYSTTVESGKCAPRVGAVAQRCASGKAEKDVLCTGSGLKCT